MDKDKQDVKLIKPALIWIFLFLFGIWSFFNIYFIDEGERCVKTTFGEVSGTWEPGLHFKFPLFQSVEVYNVRVQKTVFGDTENILTAYTNDQQIIKSYVISITWKYDANRIAEVYKNFGSSRSNNSVFYTVVSPLVQQTSKTILGQYTASTIVQERAKLESALDIKLKEKLANYPISVIGVQLEDVNFSETYEQVIEQTAQKKMEIDKAKNELQKIEIESKQAVAKADAENKAIKLRADADAYQIEIKAKAEANAIKLKAEALKANKELIDLTIAEKWNGNVPQTVIGDKGSLVPLLKVQ